MRTSIHSSTSDAGFPGFHGADRRSSMTDQAREMAEQARDMADRARQTADEARAEVGQRAAEAREAAETAGKHVADTAQTAKSESTRFVRDNPGLAVAGALGIGVAVGMALKSRS